MVKVYIPGPMAENMKENGEPIKCTARELLLGLTEENTSVNTLRIKRKVMESLSGQTVDATEENG